MNNREFYAGAAASFADTRQGAFALYWPVYDKYRITTAIVGKTRERVIEAVGDAHASPDRMGDYRFYPLESADLFWSFARLGIKGEPSEARVLGWVHRYGLLTRAEVSGKAQPPMRLQEFRKEAVCAYELLSLCRDIRAHDVEALRRRYEEPWFDYPRTAVQEAFSTFHEAPPPPRQEYRDADVIVDSLIRFESVLEGKLERVSLGHTRHVPRIRVTETPAPNDPNARIVESEPHPATVSRYVSRRLYKCRDLRSAIYLQLDLAYLDWRPVGECETCGMPFVVTRRDKRFCRAACKVKASEDRKRASA